MSTLGAVTLALVVFGALVGAVFNAPWAGAGIGLALSVGLVIFLGD